MVADSWFRNLWKTKRKHGAALEKSVVGVLAFEVASLMSKLVHLWHLLSDKQVAKLREEITKSVGIKKLVSDDDDYIVKLIYAEIIDNMVHVAKSVGRLGKRCSDLRLKNFEHTFSNLIKFGVDPYGWRFTWKKMDKKAKKMERFIAVNANLYIEMEVLADLEQTLKRMKFNDSDDGNLQEFQRKVTWKQHEVKHLKEASLWNRTCDYTVLLMARTLFTIFAKINHVFGFQQILDFGESKGSEFVNSDHIHRSHSVSALLESSVQSENSQPLFASGPLGRFTANSDPKSKAVKNKNFYSGSLVPSASTTKTGPIVGMNKNVNFYSGPLVKSTSKSGVISGISKASKKLWHTIDHSHGANGKKSQLKPNRLTQVGPFKGCMVSGIGSSTIDCHLSSNGVHSRVINELKNGDTELLDTNDLIHSNPTVSILESKLLNPPPDTLGAAALALHYANIIIVIEKLAASPHLIGIDARDDLYSMLPASVRSSLRARLKPYSKSLASSGCDTSLATEWSEAMNRILEWSAPLAHNMIRWQSERSYEQQNLVSRTNVLLVQTLYFANREKTEAIITELLVGLNYIWRLGREELNAKSLVEGTSSRIYGEYLDLDG